MPRIIAKIEDRNRIFFFFDTAKVQNAYYGDEHVAEDASYVDWGGGKHAGRKKSVTIFATNELGWANGRNRYLSPERERNED